MSDEPDRYACVVYADEVDRIAEVLKAIIDGELAGVPAELRDGLAAAALASAAGYLDGADMTKAIYNWRFKSDGVQDRLCRITDGWRKPKPESA